MSDLYFASRESKEIAEEIKSKVTNYWNYLRKSGTLNLWENIYKTYNWGSISGGKIVKAGKAGQKRVINMNHFASLLNTVVSFTTSNRPSFEAKGINSDHSSRSQAILADGLLEYYMRTKNLEILSKETVNIACKYGEGHTHTVWNEDGGAPYAADEETGIVREGDIEYSIVTPWNLVRDVTTSMPGESDWIIVVERKNKYNLAAKYKDKAGDILANPRFTTKSFSSCLMGEDTYFEKSDLINLYTFYHKDNSVIQGGRQVLCLENGTVLFDGLLQYPQIPVSTVNYLFKENSPFGSTIFFDLISPQEANRMTHSTIVTNQNAFAVQNVAVEKGTDFTADPVGDLRIMEYNAGGKAPEGVSLLATKQEVYSYAGFTEQQMETISGVNAGARGNFPPGTSGSAMFFQQQLALQTTSTLQHSYAIYLESIGTLTIRILKQFAKNPRIVQITGKYNKQYLQEFEASKLSNVDRAVVDTGNPLKRTVGGRLEIAKELMSNKLITSANEYLSILETGNLKLATEAPVAEEMLVTAENEMFLAQIERKEGDESDQGVICLITDNHAAHIPEHNALLANHDIRNNPMAIKMITDHVLDHYTKWRDADPGLQLALGQTPLPPAMQQQLEQPSVSGEVPSALSSVPIGAPAAAELPLMPELPV